MSTAAHEAWLPAAARWSGSSAECLWLTCVGSEERMAASALAAPLATAKCTAAFPSSDAWLASALASKRDLTHAPQSAIAARWSAHRPSLSSSL
eukprot:3951739-Pleurochrysis_carterae.AAC.1